MKHEFEAKFLSIDTDATRHLLKNAGFDSRSPRFLMRRQTFDFPKVSHGISKFARVRQEAKGVTMTIKETRGTGIRDTLESELKVNDFDAACAFLDACGLIRASLQENYREEWVRDELYVTIDQWPGLNPFLEVEGPSEEAVRALCNELALDIATAVHGTIDLVYERELGIDRAQINRAPSISFDAPPRP